MKDEEGRSFLQRFVEEFKAPLEEDAPLPLPPLSRKVSLEELQGESLQMGLKLLTARYDWEAEITFHPRIYIALYSRMTTISVLQIEVQVSWAKII